MGWFPWSSSGSKDRKVNDDLDAFLSDELSSVKRQLKSSTPTSPPAPLPASKPLPSSSTPSAQTTTSNPGSSRSAFPDGRYADLWKTYRPVAETEAEAEDHTSRLRNLSQAHKARERRVEEAATENCAFEAEALAKCLFAGSATDRFTMCTAASRAKTGCIEMQTKFLHALGFVATADQSSDVQDRVQIHADLMYRRMLEHEREIEEAVKAGMEVPDLKPVMSKENVQEVLRRVYNDPKSVATATATVDSETVVPVSFEAVIEQNPAQKTAYQTAIKGKTAEEVALIQREIEGQARFQIDEALNLKAVLDQERVEREKRAAQGQSGIGDYLKSWTGFNPPPKQE